MKLIERGSYIIKEKKREMRFLLLEARAEEYIPLGKFES